jgi:hypothetical protein
MPGGLSSPRGPRVPGIRSVKTDVQAGGHVEVLSRGDGLSASIRFASPEAGDWCAPAVASRAGLAHRAECANSSLGNQLCRTGIWGSSQRLHQGKLEGLKKLLETVRRSGGGPCSWG